MQKLPQRLLGIQVRKFQVQIQNFYDSIVPAKKGRCFVLLNKLQSEKSNKMNIVQKPCLSFHAKLFCILRSREKVIQDHCFVGLEK